MMTAFVMFNGDMIQCLISSCYITVFSAQQHICLARYMLSPVCPSIRLSEGCIMEKRLKLGS